MATIQLYRTDLSLFATALSAISTAVPSGPTIATANTTSAAAAAVYVTDTAGSYFVVNGSGLTYNGTTGRLTGGTITSINYQGFSTNGGSFASFGGFFALVPTLLAVAAQADPAGAFFSGSNTITVDTASLTAPGVNDFITVGGTIASHIDGSAGLDTAVFHDFRSDAAIVGGGGTEAVTIASIPTSLGSVERLQFLDGTVVESAGTIQGQTALAFQAVFGRLPDAINAGGYTSLAQQYGIGFAASQMLATSEGAADTIGLDNGQFVNRVYQSVLGRVPTTNELAAARAQLDSGRSTRGTTVAGVVTLAEATKANTGTFSAGIFAASPGAVDTLRAYEVLLGRLPEASSLGANAAALDQYYSNSYVTGIKTESLADIYRAIQVSPEFANLSTPNPYGITAGSSFGSVYAVTHSDTLTMTNLALVTATGGVPHLPG